MCMFTLNADGYFQILFEYGVSLVVCDIAKDRQRYADGYFLSLFEYGVSLVVCDVAKDRQRYVTCQCRSVDIYIHEIRGRHAGSE